MNKLKGKFEATFPEGVTSEQVKNAVLGALDALGATEAEVYAGSDDQPGQPHG